MKDLKNVVPITEEGEYKYVGFMLAEEFDYVDGGDRLAEVVIFFREAEGNKFFTLSNLDMLGATSSNPYGVWGKHVGHFNANFTVKKAVEVIDEKEVEKWHVFDKVLEELLAENNEDYNEEHVIFKQLQNEGQDNTKTDSTEE